MGTSDERAVLTGAVPAARGSRTVATSEAKTGHCVAETCRNALDSLDRCGQRLRVGLTTSDEGGEITLPTDAMVMKEIDSLGSLGIPPTRYDEIVRMVERGKLDPGAIVSETIGLADAPDGIAAMSKFDTVGIPVVTEF